MDVNRQKLDKLVEDVCEQRISTRQALGIRRKLLRRMAMDDHVAYTTTSLPSSRSDASLEDATIQMATIKQMDVKKAELVTWQSPKKVSTTQSRFALRPRLNRGKSQRTSFEALPADAIDFLNAYYLNESTTQSAAEFKRQHSNSSSASTMYSKF